MRPDLINRMKAKYYILFILFTLLVVVLFYVLLSGIDRGASWFLNALAGLGICVSIIILYRIFAGYMKIPSRKNS